MTEIKISIEEENVQPDRKSFLQKVGDRIAGWLPAWISGWWITDDIEQNKADEPAMYLAPSLFMVERERSIPPEVIPCKIPEAKIMETPKRPAVMQARKLFLSQINFDDSLAEMEERREVVGVHCNAASNP